MDYKLAKQLKEAGFPQNLITGDYFDMWISGDGELWLRDFGSKNLSLPKDFPYDTACRVPRLSELIEACGGEFESLSKYYNYWQASSAGEVRSLGDGEVFRCESDCCGVHTKGDTPEEAVALLWVALNN